MYIYIYNSVQKCHDSQHALTRNDGAKLNPSTKWQHSLSTAPVATTRPGKFSHSERPFAGEFMRLESSSKSKDPSTKKL